MIEESDPVPAQLRALGYPDAHWLAAGMEADLYSLDEQSVALLPRDAAAAATASEGPVERLLEALSRCRLPFAVPASLGRLALPDGRWLLRQPRLRGRSIGDCQGPGLMETSNQRLPEDDGLHGCTQEVPRRAA